MARYVWNRERNCFIDPQTDKPMELPEGNIAAPRIMSDLPAYMSPMGSGLIDGRAARREDMKKHNVREVAPDEWRPSERYQEKQERSRYAS